MHCISIVKEFRLVMDEESHLPLLNTLWQGIVIHFEVTCRPSCFGKGSLCTLAEGARYFPTDEGLVDIELVRVSCINPTEVNIIMWHASIV